MKGRLLLLTLLLHLWLARQVWVPGVWILVVELLLVGWMLGWMHNSVRSAKRKIQLYYWRGNVSLGAHGRTHGPAGLDDKRFCSLETCDWSFITMDILFRATYLVI
jgi:hypothetical protein